MAAIQTLVLDILADIPEAPSFAAERQYLRALRKLCQEARVWRVDGTLTTTADDPELDATPILPNLTELVDVISLKPTTGGQDLDAKTKKWLDNNATNWRNESADIGKWFVRESNDVVRIVPTPSAATSYYASVAVKPVYGQTEIDDLVSNHFSELVVHGAKGFLFMMPRKPWTDLNLAQFHMAEFEVGIPEARRLAADEFQTGVPRKVKYGGIS